jgi:hypothetical protein
VCELLATALEIVAVLGLDGVLDGAGHRVIGAENGTLHKLDLTRHTTLEAAGSRNSTARLLALSPGGGGAGLTPGIRRWCALRCAELSSWIVAASGRVDIRALVGLSRVLCWSVAYIRL